jgi:hypothetical protein
MKIFKISKIIASMLVFGAISGSFGSDFGIWHFKANYVNNGKNILGERQPNDLVAESGLTELAVVNSDELFLSFQCAGERCLLPMKWGSFCEEDDIRVWWNEKTNRYCFTNRGEFAALKDLIARHKELCEADLKESSSLTPQKSSPVLEMVENSLLKQIDHASLFLSLGETTKETSRATMIKNEDSVFLVMVRLLNDNLENDIAGHPYLTIVKMKK